MILLLIGAVWLDQQLEATFPGLILLGIGVLLAGLVAIELRDILDACEIKTSAVVLFLSALLGMLAFAWVPIADSAESGAVAMALAALMVMLGSGLWHLRKRTPAGAVRAMAGPLLVFVYLGLSLGFILALRQHRSAWVVFGVLGITKACDIGAYTAGSLFGRHKLIPWLSPGKTWEGLFGGVAVSALLGMVGVIAADSLALVWWQGLLIGAAFGGIGQVSDLLASLLKRDAGIKDSGSVVPGFGGVIDVIDSLVLIGPVAYLLLRTPVGG